MAEIEKFWKQKIENKLNSKMTKKSHYKFIRIQIDKEDNKDPLRIWFNENDLNTEHNVNRRN